MRDPSDLLPLSVALPFGAALALLLLGRRVGRAAGWIVTGAALASTAALARLTADPGGPWVFRVPWLPAIGSDLAFRGDSFGLFLGLLVAGVGALVSLYSVTYMAGEDADRVRGYFAALAAFMGAMIGIAVSDDLILLFVFWEATSISSFLLIGFHFEDERARAGATTALQVTALGGLAMLVGFLLVGQIAGTFSLEALTTDRAVIERTLASPLSTPALLLILLGAFTKSAQVPFHFWLPRAMVAPTPVSAYLHAATMVKAGVFLLGRMLPLFGESPAWVASLVAVGTTSMLLGGVQAFLETDWKAILARTTASTLGLITLLYGLAAAEQDALQILSHALYKGALFLVAGIVDHRAHTRDLRQLGGLRRELPVASAVCVLAALSMAGIPPLLGFLAKESFYAALFSSPILAAHPSVRAVVISASVVASAFAAAVAAKLTIGTFLGPHPPSLAARLASEPHHRERLPLWLAPAALAAGAVILGVLGATPVTAAIVRYAASVPAAHLHVGLVPELGPPLLASITALALAAVFYRERDRFAATLGRLSILPGAGDAWDSALRAIVTAGEVFSSRWQNGSLRWYFTGIVLAVPVLASFTLSAVGLSYRDIRLSVADMPWYGLLFCVLLGVATLTAVRATTRLQAAIATTTIGFLVAMLFVVYRSPDILLTQILIETVSTIFLLLVLIFLPAFPKVDLSRWSRIVSFLLAGAFSLAVMVLLLLAMTPGLREENNISSRPGGLLSLSLREGGGSNAVNVIIVDIRAMDTTGEVTVLVVVGLCVYGLLRARRKPA